MLERPAPVHILGSAQGFGCTFYHWLDCPVHRIGRHRVHRISSVAWRLDERLHAYKHIHLARRNWYRPFSRISRESVRDFYTCGRRKHQGRYVHERRNHHRRRTAANIHQKWIKIRPSVRIRRHISSPVTMWSSHAYFKLAKAKRIWFISLFLIVNGHIQWRPFAWRHRRERCARCQPYYIARLDTITNVKKHMLLIQTEKLMHKTPCILNHHRPCQLVIEAFFPTLQRRHAPPVHIAPNDHTIDRGANQNRCTIRSNPDRYTSRPV